MIDNRPFPELVELLVVYCPPIFWEIQTQYPQEHFYGFGLRTPIMYSYLLAECNSEKRLFQCVQNDLQYYPEKPIQDVLNDYRWSTEGWDCDPIINMKEFEPIKVWYAEHQPKFNEIPWIEWDHYTGDDFYGTTTWIERMASSLEMALPLIGERIFPNQNPAIHINTEHEVYLYAVGLDKQSIH